VYGGYGRDGSVLLPGELSVERVLGTVSADDRPRSAVVNHLPTHVTRTWRRLRTIRQSVDKLINK